MQTWGKVYWAIWLLLVLCTFLGPEIFALVSGTRMIDNTLSNWVWAHLRIQRKEDIDNWSAIDFLVFCAWISIIVWLTFHFFFRRFT
jgi:hypothetical protein